MIAPAEGGDPGARGGAPTPVDPVRVFRRSASTRAVTALCFVLFAAAAARAVHLSGPTPAFFVLAALALLSGASALGAWGDRYTLGPRGIEYRNDLLRALGGRPRVTAWSDVVEMREHRALRFGTTEPQPSAIVLVLRSGRRVVLDSLRDFEGALAVVRHYRAGSSSRRSSGATAR